jgi:hypothetical protein
MTPFEAVYGRQPPKLFSYMPGTTRQMLWTIIEERGGPYRPCYPQLMRKKIEGKKNNL